MENEKRLIDYQKAIEIAFDTLKGKVTTVTAVMLKTRLKGATVDAVEVIRCKDCRFIIDRADGTHGCYRNFVEDCKIDDFCSCGERREA